MGWLVCLRLRSIALLWLLLLGIGTGGGRGIWLLGMSRLVSAAVEASAPVALSEGTPTTTSSAMIALTVTVTVTMAMTKVGIVAPGRACGGCYGGGRWRGGRVVVGLGGGLSVRNWCVGVLVGGAGSRITSSRASGGGAGSIVSIAAWPPGRA